MLPDFVIIGAQKSASTFLQVCLSEHPDIYMPQQEVPFFESPDYEQSEIKELEELFKCRGEIRLGIKRPTYIGKPEVPERIKKHLPEAQLIAVLRDPIKRAVSAFYHNINYGFIPPFNIEDGLNQLITNPSFSKKYKRASEIIEFGFYHKYLSLYDDFFKKNQVFILLHDDIISNPLVSVKKALSFLQINTEFMPPSLNSRPQKVIYDLTRLKFLRFRNHFNYFYNRERTRLYPKKRNAIDKALAGIITSIDGKILSRLFSNEKPKISDELHGKMYELYKEDITALESLIDRDLSAWKV